MASENGSLHSHKQPVGVSPARSHRRPRSVDIREITIQLQAIGPLPGGGCRIVPEHAQRVRRVVFIALEEGPPRFCTDVSLILLPCIAQEKQPDSALTPKLFAIEHESIGGSSDLFWTCKQFSTRYEDGESFGSGYPPQSP